MNPTERYFRALGFSEPDSYDGNWSNGEDYFKKLPNITEHFPDFKKHVLEEMERRGFTLSIGSLAACWIHDSATKKYWEAVINDNEILSAAIEAACEYLEGEKG